MQSLLRLNGIDREWDCILLPALNSLDKEYQEWLLNSNSYHPSKQKILKAFSSFKPKDIQYILFGQDPYPRKESATGYAFIDGRVKSIFSDTGLSKEVNRATSLRNFIKMLLVADGYLDIVDTSQGAISKIDKSNLIDSIDELRLNFESAGVLLLNMALVFESSKEQRKHLKAWRKFIKILLDKLEPLSPKLILFGNYAKELKRVSVCEKLTTFSLEHPYNHTFIGNVEAQKLFLSMNLLKKV